MQVEGTSSTTRFIYGLQSRGYVRRVRTVMLVLLAVLMLAGCGDDGGGGGY